MNNSNTGYILEKAKYADTSIYDKEININGNFYVYAGNEDLLLTFHKWYLYVISNEKIIKVISDNPFISEEFYVNGPNIKVIFGGGIDPNVEVWNRIKKDSYGFTEREINIINKWFI